MQMEYCTHTHCMYLCGGTRMHTHTHTHMHLFDWNANGIPYIYIDNEMNMKHVRKRHDQSISEIEPKPHFQSLFSTFASYSYSRSRPGSQQFHWNHLLAESYSIFDCCNNLIPFVYEYRFLFGLPSFAYGFFGYYVHSLFIFAITLTLPWFVLLHLIADTHAN